MVISKKCNDRSNYEVCFQNWRNIINGPELCVHKDAVCKSANKWKGLRHRLLLFIRKSMFCDLSVAFRQENVHWDLTRELYEVKRIDEEAPHHVLQKNLITLTPFQILPGDIGVLFSRGKCIRQK